MTIIKSCQNNFQHINAQSLIPRPTLSFTTVLTLWLVQFWFLIMDRHLRIRHAHSYQYANQRMRVHTIYVRRAFAIEHAYYKGLKWEVILRGPLLFARILIGYIGALLSLHTEKCIVGLITSIHICSMFI